MDADSGYGEAYFSNRQHNDPIRLACFEQDRLFLNRYQAGQGTLLDVGCSTGEFTTSIKWSGAIYGMEVSEFAKPIAEKSGIRFDKDLFNQDDYFDVILFRGTIMHIDTPFLYIKKAYQALKPGGKIVFLMTPNTNSLCYRIWGALPALDLPRNFYLPSDRGLSNALANFGFQSIAVEYPYIGSPYCNLARDHLYFFLKLVGFRSLSFPFWGNMMNMIAVKSAR